jgi:hypothetical protein
MDKHVKGLLDKVTEEDQKQKARGRSDLRKKETEPKHKYGRDRESRQR